MVSCHHRNAYDGSPCLYKEMPYHLGSRKPVIIEDSAIVAFSEQCKKDIAITSQKRRLFAFDPAVMNCFSTHEELISFEQLKKNNTLFEIPQYAKSYKRIR